MKVKEILEILNNSGIAVEAEEMFGLLDNIGIENADLETDIDKIYVAKLSRRYGVDIKPVKVKVKKEPKVQPVKESKTTVEAKKEVTPVPEVEKKTAKKVEEKDTKKEVKTTEKVKTVDAVKTVDKVKTVETVKTADAVKTVETVMDNDTKKADKKEVSKKETTSVKEEVKTPQEVKTPEAVKEKTTSTDKTQVDPEVKLTRVYDDSYSEYEKTEKQYSRIRNVKKKKTKSNRQSNTQVAKEKNNVVYYIPGMTAGQLADALEVTYGEIVKKLVYLGYMVSATQPIDRDVIEILADDYGFELKDKISYDITKFEEIVIEDDEENLEKRPPIVTIMGHVDHGKTTLLDQIRKSNIVMGEAGGITQHIGAYQVKINDEKITFIDTPGHAAFTEMRARGAMVTDIVVLVVAANDGVMPQTKEAIEHAQAAKVPIIVAVNKIDLPDANPDKVKQELAARNIIASDWGGDIEFVPISAKKGLGVSDLLETIIMVAEMQNYRANPNRLGMGTVIEAELTKGRGPVATLLVKNGTINVGDPIVIGTTYGKIRAMRDETETILRSAGPSKAVEITGLMEVPQAGDHFMVFEDEKTAKLVSEERRNRATNERNAVRSVSLASMFDNLNSGNKEINLIIKGDVQGSVEALVSSLGKLDVEGVKINVVSTGVGALTNNDITLASASNSIIIGFNIRPNSMMTKLAKEKGIEIRLYNIIYKLLEDIMAAMKGMLDPVFEEKITGELEVRKIFKVSKVGTIAGCYVTDGIVNRNSEVRLIRDGVEIYKGKIGTLKHEQKDEKEITMGHECGLTIQNFNDIKEGDVIETFVMEQVED